MNNLKYIILHSSATETAPGISRAITGNEIIKLHTDKPIYNSSGQQIGGGHGWSRPGYSLYIRLNGEVEKLYNDNGDMVVDDDEYTFGILANYRTFDIELSAKQICLEGGLYNGVSTDTVTEEQFETLKNLLYGFIEENPEIKIGGHNQFPDQFTLCPGFNVTDKLKLMGINDENIYGAQ